MKKKKILVIVFFSVLVLFILWGVVPRKTAIKSYQDNSEVILVKRQTATISPWLMICGESNEDVWLTGNMPNANSYEIIAADNTYVCYGEFVEPHTSEAGECIQFDVQKWEILYPVKRNTQLPLPKSYLFFFDY